MFGVSGGELGLLVIIALLVLGPERLPGYVATLKRWIRQGRDLARAAQDQLKAETGDPFAGVDWAAYDPRQYDPRRIVREALAEEASPMPRPAQVYDASRPTPWDSEAT